MSYTNTGYTRKKILTVSKGDYSKQYDITAAFTPIIGREFAAITTAEFAKLKDSAYQSRLLAFIKYVYSQEEGLSTDCPDMTIGSTAYNTTMCPLS